MGIAPAYQAGNQANGVVATLRNHYLDLGRLQPLLSFSVLICTAHAFQDAATSVYVATAPDIPGKSGTYYSNA